MKIDDGEVLNIIEAYERGRDCAKNKNGTLGENDNPYRLGDHDKHCAVAFEHGYKSIWFWKMIDSSNIFTNTPPKKPNLSLIKRLAGKKNGL